MAVNVSGDYRLQLQRDVVWDALHDVEVLRQAVPGCQELQKSAEGTFSGSARVGIAVLQGMYRGTVRFVEEQAPSLLRIAVEAKSGHAEIKGEGILELDEQGSETLLRYSGNASLAGPIAVVGQRLLPSASKSLTEQFFRNLQQAFVNE